MLNWHRVPKSAPETLYTITSWCTDHHLISQLKLANRWWLNRLKYDQPQQGTFCDDEDDTVEPSCYFHVQRPNYRHQNRFPYGPHAWTNAQLQRSFFPALITQDGTCTLCSNYCMQAYNYCIEELISLDNSMHIDPSGFPFADKLLIYNLRLKKREGVAL